MSLRERIASLMGRVRPELAELVAIRSVADPRQFPPEEFARAARWVLDTFAGAGFSDARLAEMADGSHAEVDGRWYGRGAADCKGNIVMHLTALRALGDQVSVNLKLVVEGSEETIGAPAVTICGIDCPPVLGSAAAITPRASARLNLRVPPGMQAGEAAQALVSHLYAVAPWGVHVTADIEAPGSGFRARTGGPAYQAIAAAMHEAYGRPMVTLGEGGAIPLCNVLADTYPDAELILMGVEESLALIHAPNESVDPAEIAAMALTEALFLQHYATIRS